MLHVHLPQVFTEYEPAKGQSKKIKKKSETDLKAFIIHK